MRLRRLQLRLQTSDGPYGTTLDFPDGLVVVWADNTKGKSTCVKSILVALGMEAMLTTNQSGLPLPPAVTSLLDSGTHQHAVLESEIFLEIENSHGMRITLQRTIKGERHHNLITVHEGPILTQPSITTSTRDFFVNRSGGATREAGFHYFLARFLGWDLPTVQTYDGNEYPLYLQCIFPFFVVEQTRGWSTILPPVPTQFRIRDAYKRSIEFLLDLGAHKVALRRQELSLEKNRLESEWNTRHRRTLDLAKSVGGILHGLSEKPLAMWPPQVPVEIVLPDGQNWISLEQRILQREHEYRELVHKEIPRVQEISATAEVELADAEHNVNDQEALLSRVLDALELEQQEFVSVKQRLQALDEDIQRNKDARTLRQLGSRKNSTVESGSCPICHQSIPDTLVPLAKEQAVMSLDDNINFLTEQKRTFEAVLANSERVIQTRDKQVRSLRETLTSQREKVRALRQTLVADGRTPSIAAIKHQIQIETSIRMERDVQEQFRVIVDGFEDLSNRWNRLVIEIRALPDGDASADDAAKISAWARLLREQMDQYGFSSLPSSQITISPDTYRPEHEGFDLQTSISASDLIRTIWSYLHGILELGREKKTNHPGCIVFDEPRQQSTRDISFGQLLKRASSAGKAKQQVVFFTSENFDRLQQQLVDLPHRFMPVEGHILRKI